MTLTLDHHWAVDLTYQFDSALVAKDAVFRPGDYFRVAYSPGHMTATTILEQPINGYACPGSPIASYLTRLQFFGPDGTTYVLYDKKTNGQIHARTLCITPALNRGKVFVTDDGESMTFISDTDVLDAGQISSVEAKFTVTGYLLMKDGTRYRIEDGVVKWIRDNNGNQIKLEYSRATNFDPWMLSKVTDSLGRIVNITYCMIGMNNYDEISFQGFAGAPKSIRVYYDYLSGLLCPGSSLMQVKYLFPAIYGTGNTAPGTWTANPMLPSMVMLPDGRTYQFRYNSYGELARLVPHHGRNEGFPLK